MSDGRLLKDFLLLHFTYLERKQNRSGRSHYECKYCSIEDRNPIEHRDNRLLLHLSRVCANVPKDVKIRAAAQLMSKAGADTVFTFPAPHVLEEGQAEATSSTTSQGSLSMRKRLREDTIKATQLTEYLLPPLTSKEKQSADLVFLRFLVNARMSFRTADDPFLTQWAAILRSTYNVPSSFTIRNTLLVAENARVSAYEMARLQGQKSITLLVDGWEDLQRRSLYGTMAARRGRTPVFLELEDMTGKRADADAMVFVLEKATNDMSLDIKQTLALVTDDPTVMRKFRRIWETKYTYVIVLPCFLHGANTGVGHICKHAVMKAVISRNAKIITFFRSSHYWGGQLAEVAITLAITMHLRTHSESRWYTLILQAICIQEYRGALNSLCSRPDARAQTRGFSPVSQPVLDIVLYTPTHWDLNAQLIRYTKPLVDMIGNLETRDASLADCLIELLKSARTLESFKPLPGEDESFACHAKEELRKSFHSMNHDIHFLTLFLHPLCRRLALSNRKLARTYADVVRIALKLAKKWAWPMKAATQLTKDLHEYSLVQGPFVGGLTNAQTWWENLPISAEVRPIKSMAILLFSIVPHSAEVERLFSDLANIEGKKRTHLDVETLQSLGRLRCNYRDMIQEYDQANGRKVRRKHAHMHTREDGGIDRDALSSLEDGATDVIDSAEDAGVVDEEELERSFANLCRQDLEDWREGRSEEEIAYLERVRTASVTDCFDLAELDNVTAEKEPQALEDDVHAHMGRGGSGQWSIDNLLSSAGL